MITTPEDKAFLCKYQVGNFVVMLEDEKIEMVPSNILSIEYLNYYEYHIFAMLKVILRVDVRQRIWMLEHKRKIKIKFELSKIGMDIDVEEFITQPEEVWNRDFHVYFNEDDEEADVEVLKERLDLNEAGESSIHEIQDENYFETQNILEVYLFNPELLKPSRFNYNRPWTANTLQNGIGQILTESKHKEVLMSKVENEEVYRELLVPTNPVYKCLIYLDQYYGLYRKGALIYYDIDILYILNANGKVTAKREGEWTETCFLVPYLDGSIPGNGMIRRPGENIFYPTVSELDINAQGFSIGKNVKYGSEGKIITIDGVEIQPYEADQSYIDGRNETISFIRADHKYHKDLMQARMEENEVILYITGQNLDINAFTPNKTYKIVFEDPHKHERHGKNEYRIAYASHMIVLESEEFMSSSHRIVLKKTDGPVRIAQNRPERDPGRNQESHDYNDNEEVSKAEVLATKKEAQLRQLNNKREHSLRSSN